MCDTRTWVLKLLVVSSVIHYSWIQQCHVAALPFGATEGADVIAIPDDDSFERSSSREDLLSESQRFNLNSTYTGSSSSSNSKNTNKDDVSSASSSGGSIADRLASDNDGDGDGDGDGDEDGRDDEDDDVDVGIVRDGDEGPGGFDEDFPGSQRKFNNADDVPAKPEAGAEVDAEGDGIHHQQSVVESKAGQAFGVAVNGVELDDEKDYSGSDPMPDPTPSSAATGSTVVKSNDRGDDDGGHNGGDGEDDDEDVDEILQPMMMVSSSDKRRYNSNNGVRAIGSGTGSSTGYHAGNTDGDGVGRYKELAVTNRMKSGFPSVFEQHKAFIRNNKRYGHKTHKKRYKDYLRYSPPTTALTFTTTPISPLQKGILSRDRIFNSDDLQRPYYQGHMNYFMHTNDYEGQSVPNSFRNYHSPSYSRHHTPHHNTGHLRSGGRYRHNGAQQRPYPDYNMMNFHHLGSRAKQQHQQELEKRINAYSQYYSKWPHLTQVEDQLFEDEQADIIYPEGDSLSSNPGEIILAAEDEDSPPEKPDEDANLPPYIRKYRRRNKQLMDLLEGTKPPSTPSPQWSGSILKPGPMEGSYQKHRQRQHRQHQHHHRQHRNRPHSHRHKSSKWQIEDLFEEQQANPNNPNKTTSYHDLTSIPTIPAIIMSTPSTIRTSITSTTTLSPFDELLKHEDEHIKLLQENKLPAEDMSVSRELYDWAIDIGKDLPTNNDKPNDNTNNNNNDDDDDYIDHNRGDLYSWNSNSNPTTTTVRPGASVRRPGVYGSVVRSPLSQPVTSTTAKPINTFVYHRVVEAPRVVGAGQTGRKQRLPFVAITDRRLETSKNGSEI